ncbi:MAG TPA: CSLREA domain-containing protein, partial [Blastocatellia bacterium]|nr:CSLREA domain-containing protein [Blastocatellia bacterium]
SPGGGLITLYRGNVDSIFPNSLEAQRRKAAGTFTHPAFLSPARVFEVPIEVGFLGAGDFDADGHWDVVIAAQRGTALYFLPGDGTGSFLAARKVDMSDEVTSLVTGEVNRADGLTDIVVGVVKGRGAKVLVFEGPEGALRARPEEISVPGEPRALAIGQLDDAYPMDIAVGAGTELVIIHGRDRKLSLDETSQTEVVPARVERRAVGFDIGSIAIGLFNEKRQASVALLSSDGTVYSAFMTKVALGRKRERKVGLQVIGRWPGATRLQRVRMATGSTDDLLVLNRKSHELQAVIGAAGSPTSPATRAEVSLDVEGEPVAVESMRLNADALDDLVLLASGHIAPSVITTAASTTFTVNTADDHNDGTCDVADCSLREAIAAANSNTGADTIAFNIAGGGLHTITVASQLPDITDPVVIDGTTQPGFSGTPIIELSGDNSIFSGLNIQTSTTTVRGLAVNGFINGVMAFGGGNKIEGNFIGTDPTGTAKHGTVSSGVFVVGDNNTVGGTATPSRNLISGNKNQGVTITGVSNLVQGNFIGTDVTGTLVLGNGFDGIRVISPNNVIGGTTPGSRNVISGNAVRGVEISDFGGLATGNLVQGNLIGTDVTGASKLSPSAQEGVVIFFVSSNTIGGTTAAARNIISGNTPGILVGIGATATLVQGNFIGTDITGTAPLPNSDGIDVNGANNTVGGTAAGARNIISGNIGNGVFIFFNEAVGNQLLGNLIGTDVNGVVKIPNGENGVEVVTAATTIGGTSIGARNIISGNLQYGVLISGNTGEFNPISDSAPGSLVVGNFIGTDFTGGMKLGNGFSGVGVYTPNNTIGGTSAGSRNILSGNSVGVTIFGSQARANLILGNFIGIDATGLLPLGNTASGIQLLGSNNIVGGPEAGAGNVVSSNSIGILIAGADAQASSTTGNVVQGNLIGTDASATLPLGNSQRGVSILANNNLIGGGAAGAGNIIAFNKGAGIDVRNFNGSATGNSFRRNSIFSNDGLGIDMGPSSSFTLSDGVTPNDPCDLDQGPNNLQNFPSLTSALSNGIQIGVQGSLNATANTSFTIEFFSSPACDPAGYGEGQRFIGSTSVTTDGLCNAAFIVVLPVAVNVGQLITATATDPAGNTSEFSQCVQVQPGVLFDTCLQDDNNRNILRFNSTTGDYQFVNCSKGITLSGRGKVTPSFCKVTLQDSGPAKTPDRSVSASVNVCSKVGSAS